MSLYDTLAIRPVVNASATLTKLGGSLMPPEVLEAMADAARCWIDLEEMQRKVGDELARLTRNEAAYVATGAAAGITLAVAACVTGDDPEARQRLPHTSGLKDEVIVYKVHRNGYDFAARMVGVRMVEVGTDDGATRAALKAAFSPRTACVLWFQGAMTGKGEPSLDETIAVANAAGIPVLVDAAAQLPPTENLWRFTERGATAAIFSGGKDLCGPQASGLVVGKRWLIEAMRPHGSPNAAIGRPMKVGKEEMAGLLAAVRRYLTIDQDARRERDERVVAAWIEALGVLPGVTVVRSWPNEAGQPNPRALLRLDPAAAGCDESELVRRLWEGSPRIAVGGGAGGVYLNPMTCTDEEAVLVAAGVRAALTEGVK